MAALCKEGRLDRLLLLLAPLVLERVRPVGLLDEVRVRVRVRVGVRIRVRVRVRVNLVRIKVRVRIRVNPNPNPNLELRILDVSVGFSQLAHRLAHVEAVRRKRLDHLYARGWG